MPAGAGIFLLGDSCLFPRGGGLLHLDGEGLAFGEVEVGDEDEIVGEDSAGEAAGGGTLAGGGGGEPDGAAVGGIVVGGDGEVFIVLPGDGVGGLGVGFIEQGAPGGVAEEGDDIAVVDEAEDVLGVVVGDADALAHELADEGVDG